MLKNLHQNLKTNRPIFKIFKNLRKNTLYNKWLIIFCFLKKKTKIKSILLFKIDLLSVFCGGFRFLAWFFVVKKECAKNLTLLYYYGGVQ